MSQKDWDVSEGDLEFNARNREVIALAAIFSLLVHGSLYFALSVQAKTSWPSVPSNSALFGQTFEIETVPKYTEAPSASPTAAPLAPTSGREFPGSRSEQGTVAVAREKAQPRKLRSSGAGVEPVEDGRASEAKGEAVDAAYGQEGVARARASLFAAFVRTLPLAGKLLPGWLEAPVGQTMKVLVELRVDASGHLHDIEIVRGDTQSLLARTALKNEAFLGRGMFAIQGEREGQMLIEIVSEVEDRAPSGAAERDEAGARVVAFGQRVPPQGRPPTGAYFTYGSGKHVEFRVSVLELPR